MQSLIGIDVGTQGLRACAFNLRGELLAKEVVVFHSMNEPSPLFAEQDPLEWRTALYTACRKIAKNPAVDPDKVLALSYACTSCTAVFLDEFLQPVRPAIMWCDHRAWKEAEEISATNNPVLRYAGTVVSPEWMLPKLLWLKKHEPETLARTVHILEQTDYLTYLLSGMWTLSYNTMVAKWNYANPAGGWPEGFLEEIGVADLSDRWPDKIIPLGTPIGKLSSEMAAGTNLSENTMIVQGGMDSTAGMLGLGAYNIGEIGISYGTSTVIQCQFDKISNNLRARPDALTKGLNLIGGGETSSGAVAQWFVKQLAIDSNIKYEDFYAHLDESVAKIAPGSEGIIVQEHFQGSRNMEDPDSRGVILGLTLYHSTAHIMRAIYEAIAFGVKRFLDQLVGEEYPIKRLCAGGGLVKSQICIQILADVCGIPINRGQQKEYTALGAAIIAGKGIGIFTDFNDGIKKMVRFLSPVNPNPANKEVYDFYYQAYCRVYRQNSDLIHDVVQFENNRYK